MNRGRSGFALLMAIAVLLFLGAMITASTMSVVSTALAVDAELAALRAEAAALSVVARAAVLLPEAPAEVAVDLEDAQARARLRRLPDGDAVVLDITAAGAGDGDIRRTVRFEVVLASDEAGGVRVTQFQQSASASQAVSAGPGA